MLFLTLGCSQKQSWQLDSIASGNAIFDSARLIYADAGQSPLRLEIIRLGEEEEGFISLLRYRFTSSAETACFIEAQFVINGECRQARLPLLEGSMKLRIPPSVTEKLIEALQEGHKIDILLDGFKQEIDPTGFPDLYRQFHGSADRIENYVKRLF